MSFLDPDAANFVLKNISGNKGSFSFSLYTYNDRKMFPVRRISAPLFPIDSNPIFPSPSPTLYERDDLLNSLLPERHQQPQLPYYIERYKQPSHPYYIEKNNLSWDFIRFENDWLHRGKLNNEISKIFKGVKAQNHRDIEEKLLHTLSLIRNDEIQCYLGDGDIGISDNDDGIKNAAKAHFGELGLSPKSKLNFITSKKIIEAAKKDDFTIVRRLMTPYIHSEYSITFFDEIKNFSSIFTEEQLSSISEAEPRCAPFTDMWSTYNDWRDNAMPVGNIWIEDGKVVGITNITIPSEQNSFDGIPDDSLIFKLIN